ncbi:hypothetical protein BGZ95_005413, partial [Linnemannia exigua]
LDEKTSDRITFVVMYLLGLIVPIYALVDFGITRSQRLRDTATAAAAAAATAAVAVAASSSSNNSNNNSNINNNSNNDLHSSANATKAETKNRLADEEAFHTGAFIHHI